MAAVCGRNRRPTAGLSNAPCCPLRLQHRSAPRLVISGQIVAISGHTLGQLGDVDRDPPGLISRQHLCRRSPAGLILEIDVGQRVPGVILHDGAAILAVVSHYPSTANSDARFKPIGEGMWFSTQSYRAALNALLAEHDLGYIELIPENPFTARLRAGVIAVIKGRQPALSDDSSCVAAFNNAERVVQLNFVALGLKEIGMPPLFTGAAWQSVPKPFVAREIERKLDEAARYMEQKSGEIVRIKQSRLALEKWGLADLPENDCRG